MLRSTRILFMLSALVATTALAADRPALSGRFGAVADMTSPRGFHTLTVLADGRVLAVGGSTATGEEPTAEIYDVQLNRWTRTGPPIYTHMEHTSTVLGDGRVLVAGGRRHPASVEVFDPATGAWTPRPSMTAGRYAHTATLLGDGRVLLAGGFDPTTHRAIAAAEIFDPATGKSTPTTALPVPRSWHTAAGLPNGEVLVIGGVDDVAGGTPLATSVRFLPAKSAWAPGPNLRQARARHGMAVVEKGGRFRIVVTGGCCAGGSGLALTTAEVYEHGVVSKDGFVATGSMAEARLEVAIVALADGTVLVAGGESAEQFRNTAERLDLVTGKWSLVPGSIHARTAEMPMVLLGDGSVLISGGTMSDEVYAPTPASARFRP